MKILKSRYLIIAVMTFAMALILQFTQEYRFFAKECEHMWLNDWMWVSPHFSKPGGFIQLLTSAITQFFCFRLVGATTLAIVFGLIMWLGDKLQQRLAISYGFISLWLIPVGFMYLCNEHSYYNMRGHFAVLLSLSVAYLAVSLLDKCGSQLVKTLLVSVSVVASYWLAGSMSLIVVGMVSANIIVRRKDCLQIATVIVSYLLMAGICARAHCFVSLEEALTPAQYYEWPVSYNTPLIACITMPVVLVTGALLTSKFSKIAVKRRFFTPLIFLVGLILSVSVIGNAYHAVHNERVYLLRQDEWRARCEDWNGIIESHKGKKDPTAFISYLNLALAKKGQLVSRMAEFNPYVMWSDEAKMYSPVLMINDELSRDALKLQSCVFLQWGGEALANAQKAAFEADFLTPGETDPVELKRLVITNSLFDTEKTAQKYLRRLARTTFYADWAKRRLADATLIDNEVETLRQRLPAENGFYMKTQIGKMLHRIVQQDPENDIAAQFYEAYLIQSRDTVAYRHFLDLKVKG